MLNVILLVRNNPAAELQLLPPVATPSLRPAATVSGVLITQAALQEGRLDGPHHQPWLASFYSGFHLHLAL